LIIIKKKGIEFRIDKHRYRLEKQNKTKQNKTNKQTNKQTSKQTNKKRKKKKKKV